MVLMNQEMMRIFRWIIFSLVFALGMNPLSLHAQQVLFSGSVLDEEPYRGSSVES